MISTDWIVYIAVFAALFIFSFYALSCVDFAKFCKTGAPQKINLLLFLLSMALAFACTEAIMTLTLRQGF